MYDATQQGSKLAFVLSQLAQYHGLQKKLSTSTMVVCPFHGDKDPSGRIYHSSTSRSPGFFRCFGCGHKATWDEVAPKLGLKPFKKPKPQDEYAVELKFDLLEDLEDDQKGQLRLGGRVPANKSWRGISTNLLRQIDARLCQMYYPDTKFLTEKYIYLPCTVKGRERGFIRARFKKVKDKPSYLNSPGPWSSKYGLFPYDLAVKVMKETTRNLVVLVEGPRDALRLLSLGIPAMCILGTQSWSEAKTRILELSGADIVVLFMDGDKAGRKAIAMLKNVLTGFFDIKVQRLPVDDRRLDPGNCPVWMLNTLKRRIEKWTS